MNPKFLGHKLSCKTALKNCLCQFYFEDFSRARLYACHPTHQSPNFLNLQVICKIDRSNPPVFGDTSSLWYVSQKLYNPMNTPGIHMPCPPILLLLGISILSLHVPNNFQTPRLVYITHLKWIDPHPTRLFLFFFFFFKKICKDGCKICSYAISVSTNLGSLTWTNHNVPPGPYSHTTYPLSSKKNIKKKTLIPTPSMDCNATPRPVHQFNVNLSFAHIRVFWKNWCLGSSKSHPMSLILCSLTQSLYLIC